MFKLVSFSQDCYDAILKFINDNIIIIAGVGIGIALAEVRCETCCFKRINKLFSTAALCRRSFSSVHHSFANQKNCFRKNDYSLFLSFDNVKKSWQTKWLTETECALFNGSR